MMLVCFRLESLVHRYEDNGNVRTEDLIGPVKLAVQLLKNTAEAEKETEEIVKIDSTVPDEGTIFYNINIIYYNHLCRIQK